MPLDGMNAEDILLVGIKPWDLREVKLEDLYHNIMRTSGHGTKPRQL